MNKLIDVIKSIYKIKELRERILDGEDFAVIARQHSDDATSVVAGGDLDWVNEGGMPPEFESVIQELEENVLSEPFESTTGLFPLSASHGTSLLTKRRFIIIKTQLDLEDRISSSTLHRHLQSYIEEYALPLFQN